jgi:predicted ATPase/DNA-binding SARP family transcriptional activator
MGATSPWRLCLLGEFGLWHGETPIHLSTRKAASLLAFLVLHPGRHSREQLATLFWGDFPDVEARRSLRTALSHLRRSLGASCVIADRESVQFSPSFAIAIDSVLFQAAAEGCLAASSSDDASFLELYRGDLLPGFDDEWVTPARERLRSLYVEVVLYLAQQARAASNYGQAIALARRVLAVEAANEQAHQHLMFCLMMSGDRTAALQQYSSCRRALDDELGVAPMPETMALYAWIKGRPEHAAGYAARITNLPAPLTSLVGRRADLAACAGLLRQPEVRLLTMTGAGGSGKTRLALQLGALLLDEYEHGVFFVDLSALRQPDLLISAIGGTLGVQPGDHQPLQEALMDYLRAKTMLLVLDNFEQIVTAASQLLALLEAASGLKLLVTSRVALRIGAEREYVVLPLAVPDPQNLPDWSALSQYDAVTLFIERSLAVRPDFRVTNANAAAVAEICARLDGLPLAIELAAARSNVLSPREMLPRLGQRLGLLSSNRRDIPARHESLRKAIDWSYSLLTPERQRLFRHLAVFAGGWTLPAAEAVCRQDGDVLDGLAALVDSSLVRRVEESDGSLRFHMFEMVREFAVERLEESGEAPVVRRAHALYWLSVAEEAAPQVVGPEQRTWLDWLEADHENLRAALQWTRESGEGQTGLRFAVALREFWRRRNHVDDAAVVLPALLALPGAELPSVNRVYALSSAAGFGRDLGRNAEADRLSAEAVSLARELGDKPALAYALRERAQDDPVAIRKVLLEESLSLCREAGDTLGTARALVNLANIAYLDDYDLPKARVLSDEAIALGRACGDKAFLADTLVGAARDTWDVKESRTLLLEARSLCEELNDARTLATVVVWLAGNEDDRMEQVQGMRKGLAIAQQVGDRRQILTYQCWTAQRLIEAGELEEPQAYLDEALATARELGFGWVITVANMEMALLDCRRGHFAAVLPHLEEALRLTARGAANTWCYYFSLVHFAEQSVGVGDWQRAARCYGAVAAFEQLVGDTVGRTHPVEVRLQAQIREHMADPAVAAAWAEGEVMTIEQAGQWALGEIERELADVRA